MAILQLAHHVCQAKILQEAACQGWVHLSIWHAHQQLHQPVYCRLQRIQICCSHPQMCKQGLNLRTHFLSDWPIVSDI